MFIHLSAGGPAAHVFRYCVPAFVGVWAVYFVLGLDRRSPAERGPYVRSRLVGLVVPYLFWSAVCLMRYAADGWPAGPILANWAAGAGWPGQYFLVVLIQFTVLLPLVRPYLGKRAVWPAAGRAGWQPFVYWVPYAAVRGGRGGVGPQVALPVPARLAPGGGR